MDNSPIGILQAYLIAAKSALEQAETEMRYAGWDEYNPENVGRKPAYEAVCKAIHVAEHGNEA